jgi:hypothetical protein
MSKEYSDSEQAEGQTKQFVMKQKDDDEVSKFCNDDLTRKCASLMTHKVILNLMKILLMI